MAESTQVPNSSFAPLQPSVAEGLGNSAWKKFKLAITRSVFWAYERGTWQYDVLVLAILLFIFLTPARWFQDRPQLQLTDLRHRQGVVELAHGKEGWHYLVDARLVESMADLKTEDAIQTILRARLGKACAVKTWAPIPDKNNVTLGYSVLVTQ